MSAIYNQMPVSLRTLTNIAIGPPENGTVDFRALNVLLHSIINYLGIYDMSATITSDDNLPGLQPVGIQGSQSRKTVFELPRKSVKVKPSAMGENVLGNLGQPEAVMDPSQVYIPLVNTGKFQDKDTGSIGKGGKSQKGTPGVTRQDSGTSVNSGVRKGAAPDRARGNDTGSARAVGNQQGGTGQQAGPGGVQQGATGLQPGVGGAQPSSIAIQQGVQGARSTQQGIGGMQQGATGVQQGATGLQPGVGGVQPSSIAIQQGAAGVQGARSTQQGIGGMQQGATGLQPGVGVVQPPSSIAIQQGAAGVQGARSTQQGIGGMQQSATGVQQGATGLQPGVGGVQPPSSLAIQQGAAGVQGARSTQQGIGGMQQGGTGVQQGVGGVQPSSIAMQSSAPGMQQGARNIQQGAGGMQQTAAATQQGTAGAQQGARGTQQGAGGTQQPKPAKKVVMAKDEVTSAGGRKGKSIAAVESAQPAVGLVTSSDSDLSVDTSSFVHLHAKVSNIERQLNTLNKMPSMVEALDGQQVQLSDIFKMMRVQEKVDSQGMVLEKITEAVAELGKRIFHMKEDTGALLERNQMLTQRDAENEDLFRKLDRRVTIISDEMIRHSEMLDQLPDDLSEIPTWSLFEEALFGKKQKANEEDGNQDTSKKAVTKRGSEKFSKRKHKAESSSDGDSKDRKKRRAKERKEDVLDSPSTNTLTTGPSEILQDLLKDLGKTVQHQEEIDDKIEDIQDNLTKKADKVTVEAINPEAINAAFQEIKDQIAKTAKKGSEWKKGLRDLEKVLFSELKDIEKKWLMNHDDLKDFVADSVSNLGGVVRRSSSKQRDGLGGDEFVDFGDRAASAASSRAKSLGRQMEYSKERLMELEQQVSMISENVEELKNIAKSSSGNNPELVQRMAHALTQLRTELDAMAEKAQKLVDENLSKQANLDGLVDLIKEVEEKKADKEFVKDEIEMKADKKVLDMKVNRNLFDKTMDELNRMIEELLNKLAGHDEEWKQLVQDVSNDVETKLDRDQFMMVKDSVEKQLKILSKKINTMGSNADDMLDEAAGLRKKLAIRFNCISCDKPLDVVPHPPIPSIPYTYGLPTNRTTRPYTTYELDQIRLQGKTPCAGKAFTNFDRALMEKEVARHRPFSRPSIMPITQRGSLPSNHGNPLSEGGGGSGTGSALEMVDVYGSRRPCGGSHTMTYANNKRYVKNANQNHVEQIVGVSGGISHASSSRAATLRRNQIMGADGRMYHGRINSLGNSDSQIGDGPVTMVPYSSPDPLINPGGSGRDTFLTSLAYPQDESENQTTIQSLPPIQPPAAAPVENQAQG